MLSHDEIDALLSAAFTVREKTLVLLVLDCGIRLGEVARLRRGDVRDDCWLVVAGKVGVRQVPVSEGIARLLRTLGGGRAHLDGPAWSSDQSGREGGL